jgi:histidinol-phosphate aminotransferase
MSAILADTPARPKPKPGILDIEPYVGGKSKIEGVAEPIKLSSNENVLGCSPKAAVAFAEAAGKLSLYPDGQSGALKQAVAAKYGVEPERLVFGCGSDEIFTLLAQVYCEPGDNVVQGQYGFLAYRIAARGAGAEVRFAEASHLRLSRQSRQSHRRLAPCRRGAPPACGPAGRCNPGARRRLCGVRGRSELHGRA